MFMLPITLLIFLVLVFLVFMLFVLFSALFCAFVTFLLLNCALSFSNVLFFLVLFLFGHCQSRGKEVFRASHCNVHETSLSEIKFTHIFVLGTGTDSSLHEAVLFDVTLYVTKEKKINI